MADDLKAQLAVAKTKKMQFAFICKGAEGTLLLSAKGKVAEPLVAAAKKALGSNTVIKGSCQQDGKSMVFTVLKEPAANVALAIKSAAKAVGVAIVPAFKVDANAEADEVPPGAQAAGDSPAAGAAPSDAAAPPAAPVAAPAAGNLKGIQTALQKLGYNPGAPDGIMGPNTEKAIKAFQKDKGLDQDGKVGPLTQKALALALQGGAAPPSAPPQPQGGGAAPAAGDAGAKAPPALDFGPWKAAHAQAIKGLKDLAAKVALTKHPDAAPVLMEINALIKKLPGEPAPHEIDKLEAFIQGDESLAAAEESPKHFHDLELRKPLLAALETLRA